MEQWKEKQMWQNPAEAFKELDAKEYSFFAQSLSAYLKALINEGFTRRESLRLVEAYAKFIYDLSIEEFIREKDADVDSEDQE